MSGDHWTPGLPVVHGSMADTATQSGIEHAVEARYSPLLPADYAHRDKALSALAYVHARLGESSVS